MNENVSTGWFIQFNSNEKKEMLDLENFLVENEYPPGAEGIKELLLDTIYNDKKKEIKRNPIVEALYENPEMVQNTIVGIGSFIGKALNKKIFKK